MRIIRDTQRLKDRGLLFLFLVNPESPLGSESMNVLAAHGLPSALKNEIQPLVQELEDAHEKHLDFPETSMALSKVAEAFRGYCFRTGDACAKLASLVEAPEADCLAKAKAHPEAFALANAKHPIYWDEMLKARASIKGSDGPIHECWRGAGMAFHMVKTLVEEDAETTTVLEAFQCARRLYCSAEAFRNETDEFYRTIDHASLSLSGYIDNAIEDIERQKSMAEKVEELEAMGGQGSHAEILARGQSGYHDNGQWNENVIVQPMDVFQHPVHQEFNDIGLPFPSYSTEINPGSGLPMLDACIDVAGNAYGFGSPSAFD